MGVFNVSARMRNLFNDYLPYAERGEEVECKVMVDSGAAEFTLPTELVERLRLRPLDTIRAFTTDGGEQEYRVCGIVEVEVQVRRCQVRAIELPRGAEPLLGAVPLEEMDWHISPQEKQLVPNPRSPEKPLLPLC